MMCSSWRAADHRHCCSWIGHKTAVVARVLVETAKSVASPADPSMSRDWYGPRGSACWRFWGPDSIGQKQQPGLCAASSINADQKGRGLEDSCSFEISAWVKTGERTEESFLERVVVCKAGRCPSRLDKWWMDSWSRFFSSSPRAYWQNWRKTWRRSAREVSRCPI